MEAQQYQDHRSQADANEKNKQTDEPWSSPQIPFHVRPVSRPCINRSERRAGEAVDYAALEAVDYAALIVIACPSAAKHGRF
jgi:hypothetical protein